MEIFRSAVLTACAAGIISSLVQSAAIGSSGKKMMKLLVNTIVVISIIHPFVNDDLFEDISKLTELEEDKYYLSLESDFSQYYISNAEISVKRELDKQLEDNGIKYSSLDIRCEMDEYHVITVKQVTVSAKDKGTCDKARDLAQRLLPEAEIITVTEDNDELSEAQEQDQAAS